MSPRWERRNIALGQRRGGRRLSLWGESLHGTDVFVPRDGELRGKPLVPVWKVRRVKDGGGRWVVRREKIHQVVQDVHAAVRQQDHILGGTYGVGKKRAGEANELHRLISRLEPLVDRVNQWSRLTPASRESLKKNLFSLSKELAGVLNAFKQKSRDQLFRASLVRDKTGRINPGAALARLSSALGALHERSAEIGAISPIVAFRRQALLFERERHRRVLTDAERALAGLAKASANASPSNVRGMRARWERVRAGLETLRVAPHHDLAADVNPVIEGAFAYAGEGGWLEAQSRFNQARETVQKHLRAF